MIRTLFFFLFFSFLATSLSFSQSDSDKNTVNKEKIKKQEKKAEKERLKQIEKENKEVDSDEKQEQSGNYVPSYGVSAVKVADSIYMLKGKGGNMGLCFGNDGAFMIDDQFAEGTDAILTTVGFFTKKPVKFLINTHHHGDHTGGNENMLQKGTVIFAHENVRKRLIIEASKKVQDSINKVYEKNLEKFKKDGANEERAEVSAKRTVSELESTIVLSDNLPMITFTDDLTFHFNGEKIFVFHVHNAHTDGDALVYFTDSNVLHTGDVFVSNLYPFIDTNNGGSLDGYKAALSKILMVANDETKIIPGHGEVATTKDVKYTQSMIDFLYSRIAYHHLENKTKEQIIALNLTKDFDDKGFGNGFITTEKFFNFLYDDVVRTYRDKRRRK
ncbi:MAG: MBL fold metallo-hydrolase [Flavobacteriaceae bacterium]|nr:MBL fold metallo-hydrolase [Flavobacteriaceae bacterium]